MLVIPTVHSGFIFPDGYHRLYEPHLQQLGSVVNEHGLGDSCSR